MDVLLDEYEEMLKHTAREFFERECSPELVRRMEADELGHSVEMWRQIAALGWLGFALPQAYGGEEAPLEQLGLLLEEMGRALAPFRSWGRRKSSGHGGGLRQMAGGVWAANRGVSVHSAHVCRYGHLGRWRVSFDVRSVVEIKSWTTG